MIVTAGGASRACSTLGIEPPMRQPCSTWRLSAAMCALVLPASSMPTSQVNLLQPLKRSVRSCHVPRWIDGSKRRSLPLTIHICSSFCRTLCGPCRVQEEHSTFVGGANIEHLPRVLVDFDCGRRADCRRHVDAHAAPVDLVYADEHQRDIQPSMQPCCFSRDGQAPVFVRSFDQSREQAFQRLDGRFISRPLGRLRDGVAVYFAIV